MKLTILQQDLTGPLQSVSRSVAQRPTLPVLANVLLQAEGGFLKLSATNLELGVIKKVSADIQEEGEVTVPAKTFVEVVAALHGSKIELESTGEQLTISTPQFKATLNGISPSEFPAIPLSSERSISVSSHILLSSIPQIMFAAAADEGRPVLTGILTQIDKAALELVATDGFRLAHKLTRLSQESDSFKALIPRRTFEEVVRMISEDLGDTEKDIEISTSENQNQIIFKTSGAAISSRLIEGQFPAWEKIMPTGSVAQVVADRTELLKAVKLASVFARGDQSNITKLNIQDGKLKIASEARELGGQETEMDVQSSGEGLLVAFNSRFLIDALAASKSKEVTLKFSGNLSPTLIQPNEEEGLEYVIMPVRLN